MIFIINESVLYNEKEGTLMAIDNASNKISLLKPASRLLSLLIHNNGKLLLRDMLINEALVNHGLKPSNSSLYNYISGLRKSLAQLGQENVIVTFPRQGFQFNAKCIREENYEQGSYKENDYITSDSIPAPPTREKQRKLRHSLNRLVFTVSICLTLFAAFVLCLNSKNANVYPLGSYDKCQVYSMNLGSGDLTSIKRWVQKAGFSCTAIADVYYYDSMRNKDYGHDEPSITFCPRTGNAPCVSSYIEKEKN